ARRRRQGVKPPAPRPTRQELLDFIASRPGKVGKREIARAFSLKGADRDWLKDMLRDLKDQGSVERGRGKRLVPQGRLPEVTVLKVLSVRRDGEATAAPVNWSGDGPPPMVTLVP